MPTDVEKQPDVVANQAPSEGKSGDYYAPAKHVHFSTRPPSITKNTTGSYNLVFARDSASRNGIYAAIVLQLLAVVILTIVVFEKVYIKNPGQMSNAERTWYTVGTTILGSIISIFTSAQIKVLWVMNTMAADGKKPHSKTNLRRVASMVGLGPFQDKLFFWGTSLSFLLIGMMTAAIAAGLTPAVTLIPKDVLGYMYTGPPLKECLLPTTNANEALGYLDNHGQMVKLNPDRVFECTGPTTKNLLTPPHMMRIDEHIVFGSTLVNSDAIGAPYRVVGGFQPPIGMLNNRSASVNRYSWVSQCLPVFTKSPIRCRPGGEISYNQTHMQLGIGNCTITPQLRQPLNSPQFAYLPCYSNDSVAYIGGDEQYAGKARTIFGAVADEAWHLASLLGDEEFFKNTPNATKYSAICDIDIADALEFREIELSRLTQKNWTDLGLITELTNTNVSCSPATSKRKLKKADFLPDLVLTLGRISQVAYAADSAYSGGTTWAQVTANSGVRGSSVTDISQGKSASKLKNPIFRRSENPLEDVMGFSVATAVSAFWGINSENNTLVLKGGKGAVTGVRVGSGSYWALLYIIPELYAFWLLVFLLWRAHVHDSF